MVLSSITQLLSLLFIIVIVSRNWKNVSTIWWQPPSIFQLFVRLSYFSKKKKTAFSFCGTSFLTVILSAFLLFSFRSMSFSLFYFSFFFFVFFNAALFICLFLIFILCVNYLFSLSKFYIVLPDLCRRHSDVSDLARSVWYLIYFIFFQNVFIVGDNCFVHKKINFKQLVLRVLFSNFTRTKRWKKKKNVFGLDPFGHSSK